MFFIRFIIPTSCRRTNEFRENKTIKESTLRFLSGELNKISHRDYTTASLIQPATPDSVYEDRENTEGDFVAVGLVVDSVENSKVIIEVKKAFHQNDVLEFMLFNGDIIEVCADEILNLNESERYLKTNPGTLVKLKTKNNFQIGRAHV